MLISDYAYKILFEVKVFLPSLITLDNYDEMSDDVAQRSCIEQRLGLGLGLVLVLEANVSSPFLSILNACLPFLATTKAY